MIQDMIYIILLLLLYDTRYIYGYIISVVYYIKINILYYILLLYYLHTVICNIISCLAKTGNGPSKSCLYPTDCSLGA